LQGNPFSTKLRSLPGSPAASVISASHGLMRAASSSGALPALSLGGGRTPRTVARRSAETASLLGRCADDLTAIFMLLCICHSTWRASKEQ